ncbi:hypothetical protein M0R45_020305 [Rubus argutus]|uniref:Uncharacterized protein n=1 Tax=Rubus argutus TaxID=59490 RepID=A0AAW1XA33_RUBAR
MILNRPLQILTIYSETAGYSSRVEKTVSDCSDVGLLGDQDFEAYVGHFEQELSSVEAESAKVSSEIEGLILTHEEDFNRLNVDIGQLKCSLEFVGLQVGFP